MKLFLFLILSSVLLLINSCKKKDDNSTNITKEYNLSGKAQKGPFSPGANVTISELDTNVNPTGKSFYTTILDYDGNFQMPNVQLVSNYVELKVEGSFFDEYSGYTFINPITLYCILDISQSSHDNVNILTHLEKDLLVKYKQAGASFSDAKRQAQRDILSIFNLENVIVGNSEDLDISNGVLLATSLIVTGSKAGSNLTTILTNIRNDLNSDGVMDLTDLQTQLISQAKFIYEPDVSNHLRDFYNSNNNTTYVIPHFQNYIDTFLVNSSYLCNANYSFPIQSALGQIY
jgi:hypothetical protein